jgi:hypothetical protein
VNDVCASVRLQLLVAALFVGLIPWGVQWGHEAIVKPARVGRVMIAAESRNLGAAWEQNGVRRRVRLRNHSAGPVEIVELSLPPPFGAATPARLVVPPHGESSVNLHLNLAEKPEHAANGFDYRLAIPISILERHGPITPPRVVYLHVRRPLRLSPPTLDFGERSIAGAEYPTLFADVEAYAPLAALKATHNAAMAEVKVERRDRDGRRYQVSVTPRAALPIGEHRFTIVLRPIAAGDEALPDVPLPVMAMVLPDAACSPAMLSFGVVEPGRTYEQTVTVYSRTGKRLRVDYVQPSPNEIRIARTDSNADVESPSFRIILTPRHDGDQLRSISFRVSPIDGSQRELISAEVRYHGDRDP